MQIDNYNVYDLEESIVASGLPMKEAYSKEEFSRETAQLKWTSYEWGDNQEKNVGRAKKLASNPAGSGHCNFLSGILVSANVTATVKWWEQLQRYHFVQIVSSMSTMHRLRKMIENGTVRFHDKVDMEEVGALKEALNDVDDEWLAYNCPMGIELTARITTNYLQLKTMYNQRKNHKLKEWHDFCFWIQGLPLAKELIISERGNDEK